MTKISILGCGWLGFPLAKALLLKGFSVKGSTTSSEKLATLEKAGITPYLITLSENKITGNATDFLENSEILIIDIPPKLRGSEKENFVAKIKNVIPFIENSSVKNVLFISSTSVFNDDDAFVTEKTIPKPATESGKQLLQTEQLLQNNNHFKTTVLRFGGLISEDRHPIHFLAGRKNIDQPNAPINLIHKDDCVGIIEKIIATNSWDEIFNAVAPSHPSRETYYTQKALELSLALPQFNPANNFGGKIILSSCIENVLKYTFTKPNL